MTQIKIKRIYEAAEKSDGFRVLVDKLWPRGVKKENLHYDLWAKDIAPSTPLREWYHHNPEEKRWEEFSEKYTNELEESEAVENFVQQIKDKPTLTLLYASKNTQENHALVLQDFLAKAVEK